MVLDLIWAAGELFSVAVLIGGAWLALAATEPFASILDAAGKSTGTRVHEPLNHRLVDENRYTAEW